MKVQPPAGFISIQNFIFLYGVWIFDRPSPLKGQVVYARALTKKYQKSQARKKLLVYSL